MAHRHRGLDKNEQTLHFKHFTVTVQCTGDSVNVGIFNGADTQALAAVTVSEDDNAIRVFAAGGREVSVMRYEDY